MYFIWRRYWASPSKWLLTLYGHSLNWKWKEVEKLDESWINFLLICTAKIFYLQHSSLALYIQLMRFQIHVKERHLNCYSVWRHGTGKKKEGFHQMTEELLPDPFHSKNRATPGNAISDCHQWDCWGSPTFNLEGVLWKGRLKKEERRMKRSQCQDYSIVFNRAPKTLPLGIWCTHSTEKERN